MIQISIAMPKCCDECDIQTGGNYCPIARKPMDFEVCSYQRMPFCPLEEVPETNIGKWISVKAGMPTEKETIFAKFKGTDQWSPAMFATSSEDVRVVVRFEDGTRKVWHDNTMDGKWKCERDNVYPKRTVIYWMPNPELPKEET